MATGPEIAAKLSAGSAWQGFPEARAAVRAAHTRAEIRALARAIAGIDPAARGDAAVRRVQVAFCGSGSTDNLADAVTLQMLDRGLFAAQYHGPFGQLAQEVRDPGSGLRAFRPDLVVLAPSLAGMLPADAARDAAGVAQFASAVGDQVTALRQWFQGPVMVTGLLPPQARPSGILDARQEIGVAAFHRRAELALAEVLRGRPGCYLLDVSHLALTAGLRHTTLHKSFFLAGHQFPDELAPAIAREVAACAAALRGLARKCLVLDLDNTLWGGVVGEDGVAGIQLGSGFPGNVHVALQREILRLHEAGVILAILSKNEAADAFRAIDERPEMVLRREHFSCWRIDWQDKAANLRAIAAELGLGLDAFVVLDDSAVERSWIESAVPEAYVAPAGDVLAMLQFLAECRLFDGLTASAEDALRAKSYAARAQREQAGGSAADLAAFLRGLELVVTVGPPSPAQLGRLAQLTQKTNQFNLTTRRYSDQEIARLAGDPEWELAVCSCRDRFADDGLIGAALVHKAGPSWRIDTLLLSCRVLGRGVERAFLAWLCQRAAASGAQRIQGEYLATAKNGQVADFLGTCGFTACERTAARSVWELALPGPDLWPDWITRADPA
jgi:FkbH-like protein